MRARLISTEGPWLGAKVEVHGEILEVMDEFSLDERTAPQPGDYFDCDLTALHDEDEAWTDIFGSNAECRTGLESRGGWKYRAYGRVVGIKPFRVDCGIYVDDDLLHTSDEGVIGEYISFGITRLDASLGHAQASAPDSSATAV
jgi:hypothetical protein